LALVAAASAANSISLRRLSPSYNCSRRCLCLCSESLTRNGAADAVRDNVVLQVSQSRRRFTAANFIARPRLAAVVWHHNAVESLYGRSAVHGRPQRNCRTQRSPRRRRHWSCFNWFQYVGQLRWRQQLSEPLVSIY